MDRFDDLRTFVAVADRASVRRAADDLGRAPSAVSRRIADLEARLQTRLFTRTTRRVVLTAAGERLLERARRILADLAEAEDEASGEGESLAGRLRVAVPLSFGLEHLVPAITDFLIEHPAIEIDADLNDRAVDLVADRFDLAIRIGTLADSSLRARRLAPIHHVVAAAPTFWAEHGVPRSPEKLAGLPALCYSNLPASNLWPFSTSAARSGQVALGGRYRASNGEALVHAAVRGLGVLRLPTFLVADAIEAGDLQPVLLDVNWGRTGLHAIYPDGGYLPSRTRAFIDFLAGRFGERPVWDSCLRAHLARLDRAPPVDV